ncbi:GNAT family N-acetyltransferase [Sphingorhabdus sp. SMR4y]|uniref:GNAT family N-acetyltransferase n=1 Tax=Sphingorhabdus sp. SMR4y TaxID=2584094 RepID=UPI000B5E0801|nr:N-acetyltransferase [Sphingorhabdus sp. SMR4y]ASK87280.1 acetyltransferase (GNAT) domain protein [Sphingorhabdus sp. SMR4y]
MSLVIRPERPADQAAIHDITRRAFAPMDYADGNEQDLIDRFRAAGALALSLVAEQDGALVGQVTFTEALAVDGSPGWYTLGPVAVEPDWQGQHIGSRLIEAGLAALRKREAAGCVLTGDPAYYSRFGFRPYPDLCPEGEPAAYYQILPLRVADPDSVVGFHPLFYGTY